MVKFVNLTPHTICVAGSNGETLFEVPASGSVARCAVSSEIVQTVDGVAISRSVFGDVAGVPTPQEDVIYITSTMVAQRVARGDVVSPDTGPSAFRENGQVKAVRGFQTFFV